MTSKISQGEMTRAEWAAYKLKHGRLDYGYRAPAPPEPTAQERIAKLAQKHGLTEDEIWARIEATAADTAFRWFSTIDDSHPRYQAFLKKAQARMAKGFSDCTIRISQDEYIHDGSMFLSYLRAQGCSVTCYLGLFMSHACVRWTGPLTNHAQGKTKR